MNKIYAFDWKRNPTSIIASSISGIEAEPFLKRYNQCVDAEYHGNKNLKKLFYNEGVVKGSNSFSTVLVNNLLECQGITTSTINLYDTQKILKSGILNLNKISIDIALALRGEKDSLEPRNNPLAKSLAEQARKKGYNFSGDNPLIIPLSELRLRNADNFYGLSFELKKKAQLYNSPEFGKNNYNKKFNEINCHGVPVLNRKGKRIITTRSDGLSRVVLGENQEMFSHWDWLGLSSLNGRIILTKEIVDEPTRLCIETWD